jgi:hypothetical protein
MFNLPYSFIGGFAGGFLVLALSAHGLVQAAGFMSHARRMVLAPITLLSVSLGQVYFHEAARSFRTPRLEVLTDRLLTGMALAFTPAYLFAVLWAPDLFAAIFGEPWREAGRYAAAYSPIAYCFLFTSWPERLYEVAQRQHLSLALQVVADALGIGLLAGMLAAGVAPLTCVRTYALTYSLYHFAYLLVIYRIADFALAGLWRLLRLIALVGLVAAALLLGLRSLGQAPGVEFSLGAALAGGMALANLRRLRLPAT